MIEQLIIAVFGVGAVWLSQDPRASHRRWASVLGLLGQPAWFVATIKAEQWGIVALCAVYALSWGRGFWHYWIAPRRQST